MNRIPPELLEALNLPLGTNELPEVIQLPPMPAMAALLLLTLASTGTATAMVFDRLSQPKYQVVLSLSGMAARALMLFDPEAIEPAVVPLMRALEYPQEQIDKWRRAVRDLKAYNAEQGPLA